MKQVRCNKDLFFAPSEGEIVCTGAGASSDIKTNVVCKLVCQAAYAVPPEIQCLQTGWDFDGKAECDATAGGVSPGGQIAMIMIGLSILCGATFFYQKYRMKKAAEDKLTNGHKEKNTVDIKTQYAEHENFDKRNVMGMGKDGLDNLQTVKLSEMSPLPLPRTRPANGYHPAGKGIHDFMGTCTIGTISEHPNRQDKDFYKDNFDEF